MRSEHDIGKVLEAWLAPGPTRMPERLLLEVLDRVEREPRRRAPLVPRRFLTMFTTFTAATAAAALLVAVIGLATSQPGELSTGVVGAPDPSGDASPSSTTLEGIDGVWVSAPRDVEGLALSDTIAAWRLYGTDTQTIFELERQGYGNSDLRSEATVAGPGRLSLRSLRDKGGCPEDTVGTYGWSLSDDGARITIALVDDECGQRGSFLAGSWIDVRCDLDLFDCLGVLEPGRHASALLDARGDQHAAPVARPGGLSYTVPAGWASLVEGLSHLRLTPVEVYEAMLRDYDRGLWKDQIAVWARPVAITMDAPDCAFREDPSGGASAEELAAWLASHPDLTASVPTSITVDGHDALVLDIDLADGAGAACAGHWDESAFAPLFANGHSIDADGVHQPSSELDHWLLVAGGEDQAERSDPLRVVLVDVEGEPVLITIDTQDPADQAAFVEKAMPIVESFTFPT
jgi:hypothetical protein